MAEINNTVASHYSDYQYFTGNLTFGAAASPNAPTLNVTINNVAGVLGTSYNQLKVSGAVDFGAAANLDLNVTIPTWPSAAFPVDITVAYPFPVKTAAGMVVMTYGSRVGGSQFATVSLPGAPAHWTGSTAGLTYDDVAGTVTASGAAMLWNVHVGDTDANGIVNLADLTALATNYGNSGPAMNWSTGDFDCNGLVNLADLTALATVYGATYGGTSEVPEPCTLGLLLLGGLALIRRKR